MRRLIILAGLITALLILALRLSGGFDMIAAAAKAAQRDFQNALAGPLRQLKAGQGGAIFTLLAVAFGYGVVHAAGPGHGKVLLGGFALGSRAGAAKLVGLSLAASLAQATFAVALVFSGVLVVGWTRDQLKGVAEVWFAPLSALAIAALGLWLVARGLKHLHSACARPTPGPAIPREGHCLEAHRHNHHDHHGHAHDLAHDHEDRACAHCGHAHGPSPDQIAAVSDWRTAAALIGGIALRPCTGALFLLILTWQMGIAGAGIAGTYAMGLGTAVITITAALGAVALREGLIAGLARSRALALALPVLEITAGLLIALIATTLAYAPL